MLKPDPFERRARIYLYAKGPVRRVLRPFVRVPSQERWIFVLGCYNSGTKLLHDLIAASPVCASLPAEGVRFTSALASPEDFGWPRLWWKVEDRIRETERRRPADPDLVKRDWGIWLGGRRRVFLEKSITDALRIDWLARNFPGARFVYLLRNGYAVAEGIRRRAGRGGAALPAGLERYPLEWCARQWVRSIEVIEHGLAELPPQSSLRLTYEDLCADPLGVVDRLAAFLELDDLRGQPLEHVRDMNDRSIASLTREEVAEIDGVAGERIARSGYAIP